MHPVSARAQTTSSLPTAGVDVGSAGSLASSFIPTILALVFVLALAWGCIYMLKRIQRRAMGDSSELKFIQAMAVGQKERVVVIEYNNSRYLLGVAAAGISLLEKTPLEAMHELKTVATANVAQNMEAKAHIEKLIADKSQAKAL